MSEHLERTNYGNTGEIALLLEKLGFKVSDHNQDFPTIEKMIARRHQIVHRADRIKTPHSESYTLQAPHRRLASAEVAGRNTKFVDEPGSRYSAS